MNEVTIEAGRAERQYWRDLWRYRELFYFLAWRDILVRYKQTVIGVAWAAFRPLLTVAILTFVFARLGRMVPENYPAPLFIFCGMLPWQFFATAFAESGSSLVSNAGMISKVYFPRLVVPVSSVITSFVDFTAVAEAAFNAGLNIYGYTNQARFLYNCGILERLAARGDQTTRDYIRAARAVQRLTAPQEMGELFKVLTVGKGLAEPLLGHRHGDRLHGL